MVLDSRLDFYSFSWGFVLFDVLNFQWVVILLIFVEVVLGLSGLALQVLHDF